MRLPLSWLREYVDVELAAEELAQVLTRAGLEVTGSQSLGIPGSALEWDPERVFLAHVLKVERHPDADRLVLATVDYGADAAKVVVTGAPNLYPFLERGDVAELGLLSPLLLEGGTYFDPYREGKPTRLKGKKLRGIYNDAMLCSPVELGLGEDHEGILLMGRDELSPEGRETAPGTPLRDVLGDTVLDIDIIPNIARCASVVGVAREVAALTRTALRLPSCDVRMEGDPLGEQVRITTESPELNPRFVAILLRGVEQKAAPFWMQHRLRLAGQRPINAVVDVSNYVMLEIGQPNHTFDYDLLRRRAERYDPGGPIHIITRRARSGEVLTTLDGSERQLHPNNILVTDPQGALSLGGIMGGLESEIQPDTENVLLEAAAWNFINIRHTARQLGLQTEAAFRFSRGVHPSQALVGAKRAAELLRIAAGATVARGIVDFYPQPAAPVTVALTREYVERLSGVPLAIPAVAELLERLEFTVEQREDRLDVSVPDHRLDIEGPHDLVEEVCRMYGYDRIPATVLSDRLPPQRANVAQVREDRIKDSLVAAGLHELITYRLTTEEAEARVVTGARDDAHYVRITNPSTSDRVVMRRSLLASVLEVVAFNSRYQDSLALFEIGQVFWVQPGEALPQERTELALVMTGRRSPAHWQDDNAQWFDYFDLKGVLEDLARDLKVAWRTPAGEHPSYRPGRTGRLVLEEDDAPLGFLGELHPLVVEAYPMRLEEDQPVLAAVLDLDVLLPRIPDSFPTEAVPSYPVIHEDLALCVDVSTPAQDVKNALLEAGAPLLRDAHLFDVYTGEKVGPGKKSLAYHLTLQSPSRTLTDRDAEKLRRKILKGVEVQVGATLRE